MVDFSRNLWQAYLEIQSHFHCLNKNLCPIHQAELKSRCSGPRTPFWEAAWQSLLFKWLDNNYGVYVFIFLILLDWCSISLGLALSLWNRITHSTMKKNEVFLVNLSIYLLSLNPQWIQTKIFEIQVLFNAHKDITCNASIALFSLTWQPYHAGTVPCSFRVHWAVYF